jgi:hypothetical protein
MSVSQTDVDAAGATYASAIAAAITAYVTLKATEMKMDSQGSALAAGGRFGSETNEIDLIPFRHPKYAPNVDTPRLTDQIVAKMAQL